MSPPAITLNNILNVSDAISCKQVARLSVFVSTKVISWFREGAQVRFVFLQLIRNLCRTAQFICKLILSSWLDQQIISRCLLKRVPAELFRQSVCAAPKLFSVIRCEHFRVWDEVSLRVKRLLTSILSHLRPLISSRRRCLSLASLFFSKWSSRTL